MKLIHSRRKSSPARHGPAEFKVAGERLLNAFPDLQVGVEDTATDGDQVVVRWRARRTHRVDGLCMSPPNRKVGLRGMTWLTFENGVILKGWDSWNLGSLLESLKRAALP